MAAIPIGIFNWSVYKITNPNNKVYIGLTLDIEGRKKDYQRHDCKNQIALQRSLNKYGFSSHNFEIIDDFKSNYEYALGKEMFWIRSWMSNAGKYPEQNGLNMTDGGRGSMGRRLSEETKEKLRQANLGKKYSEETKKKLSLLRKGKKINRIWTKEQLEAQSKRVKGFKHTEEAKRKISEAGIGNKYNLGRKQSAETIQKRVKHLIGNKFNVGRKQSEESKVKKSLALKGRKHTPEAILRIRKSHENIKGKEIIQYDLYSNPIAEFISIREAAKKTHLQRRSIQNLLENRVKTPKKFIFKYKTI